jgi:hypothetical protein
MLRIRMMTLACECLPSIFLALVFLADSGNNKNEGERGRELTATIPTRASDAATCLRGTGWGRKGEEHCKSTLRGTRNTSLMVVALGSLGIQTLPTLIEVAPVGYFCGCCRFGCVLM